MSENFDFEFLDKLFEIETPKFEFEFEFDPEPLEETRKKISDRENEKNNTAERL